MIAVRNIEHDWKRSLSTVIVLSLVGLLIFQQFGSVLGRWNSLGGFEREFRVDLVVKAKNPSNRISRPIAANLPPGVANILVTHPSVKQIQSYRGVPESIRFDGDPVQVDIYYFSVEPTENPILYPRSFPDELLALLQLEGNAIANRTFAKRYDLDLGDTLTHQGYDLRFVGFVDSLNSVGALMVVSNLTASAMSINGTRPHQGMMLGAAFNERAFLLRLADGSDPAIVAGELRGMIANPAVEVIFPEQLVSEQSFALLFEDRDNRGFLITAVFAIVISILIAIQTMRGAVLNHADEYGALQALGVGGLDLRLIAIETSFWLGLLSTAIAISGAFVMQTILRSMDAQFALSAQLVFVVASLLMGISLIAGLFASSAVTRIRPEALLR